MSKSDIGMVHDVILESIGESWADERIVIWCENLPNEYKIDAIKWGWNDTVLRNNLYEFIKNNA